MILRLILSFLMALPVLAQTLVLDHARIIDGTGKAAVEDGRIVISNGRIQSIGPASSVKAPANAQVQDLSGKTIMPGIINLHGHVGNVEGLKQDASYFTRDNIEENLRLYAKYGVTATTSMGSDTDDTMLAVRKRQRDGELIGARVYTALQGFTLPSGYPTQAPGMKGVVNEVSTAAQARAKVDELAKKKPDVIKMWVDSHHGKMKKIPPEIYSAIISQSKKNNLLTAAHIYELSDAKSLAKAGIDIIGHSIRDAVVDQEAITLFKQNNVTYVPTLAREVSTFAYADDPEWLNDPYFSKEVEPEVLKGLKTTMKETQRKDPEYDINKKGLEIAKQNAKKLYDAGVRVGFGTDSGPPGRFPGFAEHYEMQLMAEAGFMPMEIIQTFSKNAAEALRISKDFGTLEKGKMADLVVLDKNPLQDIHNTRAIYAVYIGGKKVGSGESQRSKR